MSHTDSKFVESFFNCSWVTNSGRGFEPFCNINVHKSLQFSLYILFSKDAIIHLQVILLVKKALQECWLMTVLLSSRFFQVFFTTYTAANNLLNETFFQACLSRFLSHFKRHLWWRWLTSNVFSIFQLQITFYSVLLLWSWALWPSKQKGKWSRQLSWIASCNNMDMLKKMYTNFQPSIFSIRTYSYIYFYPKEL